MANFWENDPVASSGGGSWQNDPVVGSAPKAQSSWSDLPSNILPSAYNFGAGIAGAVAHPINTLNSVVSLANGEENKLRAMVGINPIGQSAIDKYLLAGPGDNSPQSQAKSAAMADAFNTAMKNRYGGWDATRNSIINDPVGVAGDLSAVLTAGGSGLARLAPQASKIADIANITAKAGDVINPISVAGRGISVAAKPAASVGASLLGFPSGVGADTISAAYAAGRDGGAASKAFTDNMRGNVPQEAVLQDMQAAMGKMAADASNNYRAGIQATKASTAPMDYAPIENAMQDVTDSLFHGNVPVTDAASLSLAKQIGQKIDEFKQNYPNPTPYDFDRLKVSIDKLKPNFTQTSGDQGRIVTAMRNAVKDEILANDPTYAKTMKDYETAKNLETDIQQALGTGKNKDATLRKLQSVFRNNANTNYGSRMNAAQTLQNASGRQILPQLAGQMANTVFPRGLVGQMQAGGLLGVGTFLHNPAAIAALPMASPRFVGELTHAAGKVAGKAAKFSNAVPVPSVRQLLLGSLLGQNVQPAY